MYWSPRRVGHADPSTAYAPYFCSASASLSAGLAQAEAGDVGARRQGEQRAVRNVTRAQIRAAVTVPSVEAAGHTTLFWSCVPQLCLLCESAICRACWILYPGVLTSWPRRRPNIPATPAALSAHARAAGLAMPEALCIPLAVNGGGRLAIVPAPVIEFMRRIAGGIVYDDHSISRQQIVRILRNAKRHGKTNVVVRSGVGNREKRIGRAYFDRR